MYSNLERPQETEATLFELVAVHNIRFELDLAVESSWAERWDQQAKENALGQRFEAELELASLRIKMGSQAVAGYQLAYNLIDDSSASPLVRARAMVCLAEMHLGQQAAMTAGVEEEAAEKETRLPAVEEAAASENIEWAAPTNDPEAERLLNRASVLLSGILNGQLPCTRWSAPAIEWYELYECFVMHANVLDRLGRVEQASEVRAKADEIFEESEDGEEEGEGEGGGSESLDCD